MVGSVVKTARLTTSIFCQWSEFVNLSRLVQLVELSGLGSIYRISLVDESVDESIKLGSLIEQFKLLNPSWSWLGELRGPIWSYPVYHAMQFWVSWCNKLSGTISMIHCSNGMMIGISFVKKQRTNKWFLYSEGRITDDKFWDSFLYLLSVKLREWWILNPSTISFNLVFIHSKSNLIYKEIISRFRSGWMTIWEPPWSSSTHYVNIFDLEYHQNFIIR